MMKDAIVNEKKKKSVKGRDVKDYEESKESGSGIIYEEEM